MEFLTTTQAAKKLNMSYTMLHRYLINDRIPRAIKIGSFYFLPIDINLIDIKPNIKKVKRTKK